MATFVLKAHLSKPDGSVETRRFPISQQLTSSPGLFEFVNKKIGNLFTDLERRSFRLMWKDSDGDFVLMSSDEEIQDAISTIGNSSLQVYVQVDEDKKAENTTESPAEPMEESEAQKGNERQSGDEWQGFPGVDFGYGVMGPPPPPPPPPMFPFGFGPFMCKGKGKGRFGKHHHRGPMGTGPCGNKHHGPMGPGPFGKHHPRGPFGPHGCHMGPHRGPMGPHGDSMGSGPFGKHHRRGPMGPGPFGNHPLGGPMGPGLFLGAMGPHDIGPFGMSHDHHHHHGWKAQLRNAVPLLHRQWTKLFIQKWREQNIANATTTTSENDTDDELTMEKAGVPEAYKTWLLLLLPKWHKKWGVYKLNGKEKDGDSEKEQRKLIKTSVPNEFRKWVKWYLQRNFGQRMPPRFKGQEWSPQEEGLFVKPRCVKRRMLASMVPASHRLWTKKFIHDWRVERKLESPSQAISTTSESENENADLNKDELSVPKAYGQWLGIFLPKWHHWRGLIEKNDMPNEKKYVGQFRDTVPMDFRAWVKHYMCRQYGRQRPTQSPGQEDKDVAGNKYKNWLKLFKKKWLQEQRAMGDDSEDFTVVTSGDETDPLTVGPSDDNAGIPDTSFKRLRLSDEEDETPQKSVHFDPSSLQQPLEQNKLQRKMMKQMMRSALDSEDGADEMVMEVREGRRKQPINHNFRKWAWEELDNWEWDGQSMNDDISTETQNFTQATDDTDIPPHVYQWMSKVMMKLQMKKMKQEMKAAKREMKATQKQAKAERKAAKQAAKLRE